MLHSEIDASQSLYKCDRVFKEKICTSSFKLLVGLLLDHDDDISCFLPRVLISFAVESVLSVIWRTFIDDGIDNLLLLLDFLSITLLALILFVDDFAFAIAIITRSLRLGVHAGSKLLHTGDNTAATTRCALLDSAFFASSTFACFANSVSVHCNFCVLSIVDLLQSAF